MRILRLVFSVMVVFLLFFMCHFKHGKLPPLGRFLDPSAGFWQNNARLDKIPELLRIQGLNEDVQVVYDDRRVPHIFAKNDHDLYLAQGYVVAKERLWQMELQTHLAAGRMAEIVGKAALELDRYNRRIGLAYGAERAWESLNDEKGREVLEAYSDGVNAFISELHKKDYPLEYKILDYKPEKWTPFKSILMLKLMSKTLSGSSDEPSMTALREFLGEETTDELFPLRPPFPDPIIPAGTGWNMDIQLPEPPSPEKYPKNGSPGDIDENQQSVGSNNWAVAGKRTKSGAPILCNDPHLELNLPSIWFEMQLSAPGVNVYGVEDRNFLFLFTTMFSHFHPISTL